MTFVQGNTVYGEVSSVEDYGYIVSLAVGDLKGFLPFVEVDKNKADATTLQCGQCIVAVIMEVSSGRMAKLTMKRLVQLERGLHDSNSEFIRAGRTWRENFFCNYFFEPKLRLAMHFKSNFFSFSVESCSNSCKHRNLHSFFIEPRTSRCARTLYAGDTVAACALLVRS